MSYIIKSPDELKDPFLCYCVFHRFMEEAGEDYIDYNERIVNGTPLLFWMLGKGYISDKETEEVLKRSNGRYIYVSDILKDDAIFKESYGDTSIGSAKSYSILAEYMCQISEFRQRLYDSVNNNATWFENHEFYKDENEIIYTSMTGKNATILADRFTVDMCKPWGNVCICYKRRS